MESLAWILRIYLDLEVNLANACTELQKFNAGLFDSNFSSCNCTYLQKYYFICKNN